MAQSQRQEKIVNLVRQRGFMSIEELVSFCEVTPQTIRRDLNALSKSGIISRHHGGAGMPTSWENTPYKERKTQHHDVKEQIATAVANIIPDNASLFINIGTTTELIAKKLLNHNNLHVVTNNIHVASILSVKEDFTVIIAAGEVRYKDGGIIGEATCDFISQFRMDYGVVGISGISSDGTLLDFDFREVKVSRAILEHTSKVILAADSSKFERHAMVQQGHLSQIDYLVSDEYPPSSIQDVIDEHDVTFVKA